MDCNVQVVFFLSLHQVRLDFPSVTAVCPLRKFTLCEVPLPHLAYSEIVKCSKIAITVKYKLQGDRDKM